MRCALVQLSRSNAERWRLSELTVGTDIVSLCLCRWYLRQVDEPRRSPSPGAGSDEYRDDDEYDDEYGDDGYGDDDRDDGRDRDAGAAYSQYRVDGSSPRGYDAPVQSQSHFTSPSQQQYQQQAQQQYQQQYSSPSAQSHTVPPMYQASPGTSPGSGQRLYWQPPANMVAQTPLGTPPVNADRQLTVESRDAGIAAFREQLYGAMVKIKEQSAVIDQQESLLLQVHETIHEVQQHLTHKVCVYVRACVRGWR